MIPESSPPINDNNEASGLGFQSITGLFRSRRNHKHDQQQADASSDRSALRSRPIHNRSHRHRWCTLGKKWCIILFLLCAVSLLIQTYMASVFIERNEQPRFREAEAQFGKTLQFVPRWFIGGNKLDRVHFEVLKGVRKPRLAIILGKMEKDPQTLLLFTVMESIKELGYGIEIFAVDDGKARRIWEQLGQLFLLRPEDYGHIDWSRFEGIVMDSVEVKEAIVSIELEPFCSIPLIWVIQDDILAKRLEMYEEKGWTNLISHWRSTFRRASVIVFPNSALPMLYSALDTGNFHVIQGSPADTWVAEVFSKSISKYEIREEYEFDREDIVVLVVGSSFFYNELSLKYEVAFPSIEPLLNKYARKKNAGVSLKFVFLCGSSDEYDDVLQAITSRLGLLPGHLRHYGFEYEVNDILLMADIVLYGSLQNVPDFPPLLIRAMTFGIPIVAPDLPIIKEHIVEGFHGMVFSRYNPDALIRTFSTLISDGKLSRTAYNVASTGRLLAKNMFASECVTGYASLLEKVINFPSDIMPPDSIAQLPKVVWKWEYFRKELEQGFFGEQNDENVKRKSSVVTTLEEEFSKQIDTLNISISGEEIQAHVIPTQQDLDIIEEIESVEEYDRAEMEEIQGRTDRNLGVWEELYRRARKCDKIKLENEKDERELERAGQPVCVYEIYSGPAAWPFLHHDSLYRGLSLSTGARRLNSDDVNAVQRLPLLSDSFYQATICEIGGMFAIANKIDTIHRRPWIGFQSWKADGRKVSISAKAERALEEAIQKSTRGEVIYFWACLNVDQRFLNCNDANPFWAICDILNREHCSTTFEDAFRHMYGLPSDADALPPMPYDGDSWSALHSWVMPTSTFMEFMMFSRIFVDSLDAVHRNFTQSNGCFLASSRPERKHCYCRLLEILVNVWAYHSGRKMVYLNPRSGLLEEQHLVADRQEFIWSKFFNITLLKAMDEDLAEAADDDDHPRQKWLWPLTGEVIWQGIYDREKEERQKQRKDKKKKPKRKKPNKKAGHVQKPLG